MVMTCASKYRLSRIASLLAILAIVYCFYRAIPPGMSGEAQVVKVWLGAAFFASAVGIACALTTYYFLAKSKAQNTGKDAVGILGAVGRGSRPRGAAASKADKKAYNRK